jgi:hypothetical protein
MRMIRVVTSKKYYGKGRITINAEFDRIIKTHEKRKTQEAAEGPDAKKRRPRTPKKKTTPPNTVQTKLDKGLWTLAQIRSMPDTPVEEDDDDAPSAPVALANGVNQLVPRAANYVDDDAAAVPVGAANTKGRRTKKPRTSMTKVLQIAKEVKKAVNAKKKQVKQKVVHQSTITTPLEKRTNEVVIDISEEQEVDRDNGGPLADGYQAQNVPLHPNQLPPNFSKSNGYMNAASLVGSFQWVAAQ